MPDRHGPMRSFTENSAAYNTGDFGDDQWSNLNDALQQIDPDWLGDDGVGGEPVDIGSIEIADVESVFLGFEPPFGVLPIDSVRFTGETGPIVLKDIFGEIKADTSESDDPRFIIGLHSPRVGSGAPDSRDSLIGVRPLPPGTYSSGSSLPGEIPGVPILPTPFTKVRPLEALQYSDKIPFGTPEQRGEDHPGIAPLLNAFRAALLETAEVTATLWHGPPDSIDPSGPILEGGSLIRDTQSVSFVSPEQ